MAAHVARDAPNTPPAPAASALAPRTAYAEQSYWEWRYAEVTKDGQLSEPPVWYVGWPELRDALLGQVGPLGDAALSAPALVLELGCGHRPLAVDLAADGFEVIAADFSPAAFRRAEADLSAPVRSAAVADVRLLPFRDGSFDYVLDKACFDALRPRDSAAALSEVCRVLRPGGRFLCVSNNETLLRHHARKLPGWSAAPGTPFYVGGVDDEVVVHCYTRSSAGARRATPRASAPPAAPPARDAAAPMPVAAAVAAPRAEEGGSCIEVDVPWATSAADIALWRSPSGSRLFVAPASSPSVSGVPARPVLSASSQEPVVVSSEVGAELVLPPQLTLGASSAGGVASSFSRRRRRLRVHVEQVGGAPLSVPRR